MSNQKFKEGDLLAFNGRNRSGYSASEFATAICKGYKGKWVVVEWVRNGFDRGQQNGNYYEEMFTLKLAPPKKELPKSFACKNTDEVLWKKYIAWFNEKSGCDVHGFLTNGHYGFNNTNNAGDVYTAPENIIKHFDVILSLEEWDEIVNEQTKIEKMNTQSITRSQLKEIHDIACTGWQKKIEEFAGRNPFGDTIEFTDAEVQEMFDAATSSQFEVINRLFKKPTKDIDLSTGEVDGVGLFIMNGAGMDSLISVRHTGDYKNISFYLNTQYNWQFKEDNYGHTVLVPTRK